MGTSEKEDGSELTKDLKQASILVVDDEPGMRNFLVKTLTPHCKFVAEAATVAAAENQLKDRYFDIVVLDNMMPGQKGIDWLASRHASGEFTDAIMVTAYADLETAIDALRAGASDFVLKPFRSNQLLNAVRRCLQVTRLRRENLLLKRELEQATQTRLVRSELLGDSAALTQIKAILDRIKNLATPVLFAGASGTGKEVAARYLHAISDRRDNPFVPIGCGSIPDDLVEYELFGHQDGAFPGARAGREGLLASANGGTVFFDEITDLSLSAQSKLVRVLEDGAIRSVGSERMIDVDLRLLFATNKSLAQEVAAGRFREDLYFRINVLDVSMPPLPQRENDVVILAEHFMAELAKRLRLAPLEIDSTTKSALLRHDWPGNIRELRNIIERSLILGRFAIETLSPVPANKAIEPLEDVERRTILTALEAVSGNKTEAARKLGVSRKTIDRKCAAWGL